MIRRMFLLFCNSRVASAISTLSLHDALPISDEGQRRGKDRPRPRHPLPLGLPLQRRRAQGPPRPLRSEEHTSELQSRRDLVCRLLLEKKKKLIIRRAERRSKK